MENCNFLVSPVSLSRRFVSRRTGRNSICSGLNHDRSLLVSFPMGYLSQEKSSYQTSYFAGLTGKHTHMYPYFRRQATRCQRTRSAPLRNRRIEFHDLKTQKHLCFSSTILPCHHQRKLSYTAVGGRSSCSSDGSSNTCE